MIDFKYGKLQIFLRKRLAAKQPICAAVRDEVGRASERREMLLHNDDEGDELYIPESTMYVGLADHASTDGVLRNIDMLAGGLLLAKDTLWESRDREDDMVKFGYAIDDLRKAVDLNTLPERTVFSRLLNHVDKAIHVLNDNLGNAGRKNIVDIRTQAIHKQAGRISNTIVDGKINMAQAAAEKPASMEYRPYMDMLHNALELSRTDGRGAFGIISEQLQSLPVDTQSVESILEQDRKLGHAIQANIDCLKATRECLVEAAKASGYNVTRSAAKAR